MAFLGKLWPILINVGASVIMFEATCATASAQEVKIATSYKLMTLDPQYADLNENTSLLSHVFERLVYQDEAMQPRPGLALTWQRLSRSQWQFKLRANVRFHDGSPFSATDVVYSIDRIRHFLKPPGGGFAAYVQDITSVSAPDPLTVIIETSDDAPTLPLALSSVFIMRHQGKGFEATDDLNTGSSVIGTGPYKFAGWQSGETLQLVRNDDYWGGRPAWSRVDFRVVESPAARVAALTTGDVDIADYIPARDVETLKSRGARIESTSAARSNFLQFDVSRETVPGVTDASGKTIRNPFRDVRVRQALAMATDRPFLTEKILLGYGTAAAQLFPTGMPGTSRGQTAERPDYERAKALLASAGFPDGFNVVLGGPAGRYPGDSEALQSVAQNWARIGVHAQPTVAPYSVYAGKLEHGDYPAWYAGCSGNAVTVCLDAVLASRDNARQKGSLNYGGYSNPAFDTMLENAEAIDTGPERDAALANATDLVMADAPVIPLYHFHLIVGYGARVASYRVHPRGWTTAMQAVPAGG